MLNPPLWLPPLVPTLLGVVLMLSMALLPLLLSLGPQPAGRAYRRGYLSSLLLCGSALLLSGCGTAPLQVPQCPPVPAELLTPPQNPVLLRPTSPSTTPGPTTTRTRRDAGSTGPTTSD